MKKTFLLSLTLLCALTMRADWEAVHMFVVPEALWSEWQADYTLKVSLKRWNGSDSDFENWADYTFSRTAATYEGKAVYAGDVWILHGGFAQMNFDAINADTAALPTFTFWPPETADGHWIAKADFAYKAFISWNATEGIVDFPFISSTAGNRVWFDNTDSQWTNVYLRIGRTDQTGLGAYTSTWAMNKLDTTDYWYVDVEDWSNAEAWTITDTNDNNGDGNSIYNLPAGANRLYFYYYSIDDDYAYAADGAAAQGTEDGVNYWANHSFDPSTIPSGLELINADGKHAAKMIHDGQLFILRDGKVYNAQGKMVK